MRSILLLLAILIFGTFVAPAQVIWTENFSAGSAAKGTLAAGYPGSAGGSWTQTNNVNGSGEGAAANQWFVSGEECGNAPPACGTACSNGDASLHVSAIGGLCGTPDCGAAYDATNASNITDKRVESPLINTTGYGGLTLTFNYIAAQDDDFVRVLYSCNGGSSWTAFAALPASLCCGIFGGTGSCASLFNIQGVWTLRSYALPACAQNNPNLKIAFHWINDGDGLGNDPSIAIDDMAITATTILPVELIAFQGQEVDSGYELKWSTASEINNSHFEIERSASGEQFENIGSVSGNGTTNEVVHYTFFDRNPLRGTNLYRLKQVDVDGNFVHTEIIVYENNAIDTDRMYLFPNPVNDQMQLNMFVESSGIAVFTITDLAGRSIQTLERRLDVGTAEIIISTSNLSTGNYIVHVQLPTQQFSSYFRK